MSYKIYIKDKDGRNLVEANANYRTCELYRECCKNVEIEDSTDTVELIRQMPNDDDLALIYGIERGAKDLESAAIVMGAMLGGGVLILLAMLFGA